MSAQKTINNILSELGLNADEFADNVGSSQSTISRIVSGKQYKISTSLARKISAVYPQYELKYLLNCHLEEKNNSGNLEFLKEKTASNKIKVGQNEVEIDDFVESLVVNEDILRQHPTMKLWITKIEQEGAIRILVNDRTKA